MIGMGAQEEAVGRHYDEVILAYEMERLPVHCPVEYAITARYLLRWPRRRGNRSCGRMRRTTRTHSAPGADWEAATTALCPNTPRVTGLH